MEGGRIRDLVAHGSCTVIIIMMIIIMVFIAHKVKIHILRYNCHEYTNHRILTTVEPR